MFVDYFFMRLLFQELQSLPDYVGRPLAWLAWLACPGKCGNRSVFWRCAFFNDLGMDSMGFSKLQEESSVWTWAE